MSVCVPVHLYVCDMGVCVCVCDDGCSQVGGQSRLSENTLSPAVDVILALFEVRLSPAPAHTLIHTHIHTLTGETSRPLHASQSTNSCFDVMCRFACACMCVSVNL